MRRAGGVVWVCRRRGWLPARQRRRVRRRLGVAGVPGGEVRVVWRDIVCLAWLVGGGPAQGAGWLGS
jgi:hypothetical protein